MNEMQSFFVSAMLGAILTSCWLIMDIVRNKKMRFGVAFAVSGLTMFIIYGVACILYQ